MTIVLKMKLDLIYQVQGVKAIHPIEELLLCFYSTVLRVTL